MSISNQHFNSEPLATHNLIRWSAIFGGLVGAFVVLFLLNLLSTGLGFAAMTPSKDSMMHVGMGVLVWFAVSSIISSYLGGWIAGRFSGSNSSCNGLFHGFLVSCLSIILMLFVMTSAVGSVVGGSFSLLGKGVNTAASATSGVGSSVASSIKSLGDASPQDMKESVEKAADKLPESFQPAVKEIKENLNALMKDVSKDVKDKTPSADEAKDMSNNAKEKAKEVKDKILPAVYAYAKSINTPEADNARSDLLDTLSEATGKSKADLEATVDKWQQQLADAKEKAKAAAEQAADEAASAMSYFAFINFAILMLGLIAACLGGYLSVRRTA